MLIVLVGLGTWQVYRLHWKEGILAQIKTAEAAKAVPLPAKPQSYTKVSVIGQFRFDLAAEFGVEVRDTRAGATLGSYQIVPLEREGASTILVNRGWVPERGRTSPGEPSGPVMVTGYVRPSDQPSWFSATDDPIHRRFFTLDSKNILASLGVTNPATFILVVLGPTTPEAYPVPAAHLPQPPNNHFSYALTWYGLAVALVVIFVVWTRRMLRS
jgi:surfeit locus 1 family protein